MTRGFWLALLVATLPAACESGGLVGGACRSGFRDCDGKCVDLLTDNRNCGACGVVCPAGRTCHEGRYCEGFGEHEAGAAGSAGAAGTAGAGGSAGAASGAGGGGGESGACNAPFDTADHCGDCDTSCSGSTPLCECTATNCSCVADCDPAFSPCGSTCTDLTSDPSHCGACNHVCPTGLCQGSACVGSVPGHVVVICNSYEQTQQQHPQTVLLGNAVFLSRAAPVRVLAYEEHAAAGAVGRIVQTLNWAAQGSGRSYTIATAASAAQVSTTLDIGSYEVLLVLDQPAAPPGDLATIGASWATPLDAFVLAGGTVIVLQGSGGVGEMTTLVDSAGLFADDGESPIAPSGLLYNRAPADSVGVSVLSPFLPLQGSCRLSTAVVPDQFTVFVVTDTAPGGALGNPAVVHQIRGM
jgi:hypothetical protein